MVSLRVVVAVALAAATAAAGPVQAACGNPVLTVSDHGGLVAVVPAAGTSRVIARLPARANGAPAPRLALDGASGAERWRYGMVPGHGVSARSGGGRVTDVSTSRRGGCLLVGSVTRRAADGRVVASADGGVVAAPGEVTANVVSVAAGDVSPEPGTESLVELRTATERSAAGIGIYTPDAYRDATPGIARRGTVMVLGERGVLKRFSAAAVPGPGPIAGVYRRSGRDRAFVVLNESGDDTSARVRVTSWAAGRTDWTAVATVLPDPGYAVALSTGPGLVTGELLRPPAAPLSLTYVRMRFTAFDGGTGRVLWTRDWVSAGSAVHFDSLDGDLLVQDERLGVVSRLRAADGTPVWETPYGDTQQYTVYAPAELTGDRVPDVLIRDAATGPTIVSGADGALLPRPPLLSGASVWVVGDLDGDGASDLISIVGSSYAVGVVLTASVEALAVSGATGAPLWRSPLGAAATAAVVGSGPLLPGGGTDVVVYQLGVAVGAYDGATGARLWSRPVTAG